MAVLKKVAEGDEIAFRVIFDRYWDAVYGVALALTKLPGHAEEITQDVFLKIWLKRESVSGIGKFEAYLFTVARNHIFNEFRKKIKTVAFTDHLAEHLQTVVNTPHECLLYHELEQLTAKAIEQLAPQQRTIYCLSREQGLSQEEIAASLHISRHTVKSHMNKALHVIRRYLGSHTTIEIVLLYSFLYLAGF